MNRPRNGRDYAGVAVLILAITLSVILLASLVASLLGRDISDAAGRLLTTIGAGLVGAVATYIGTAHRDRGDRDRRGDGDGNPPPPAG